MTLRHSICGHFRDCSGKKTHVKDFGGECNSWNIWNWKAIKMVFFCWVFEWMRSLIQCRSIQKASSRWTPYSIHRVEATLLWWWGGGGGLRSNQDLHLGGHLLASNDSFFSFILSPRMTVSPNMSFRLFKAALFGILNLRSCFSARALLHYWLSRGRASSDMVICVYQNRSSWAARKNTCCFLDCTKP